MDQNNTSTQTYNTTINNQAIQLTDQNSVPPMGINPQTSITDSPVGKNSSSKKIVYLIAVIVVLITLLLLGVIFIPKLFETPENSEGDNTSNGISNELKSPTKIGDFKTFEGYSEMYKCGNFYYILNNDTNTIVVDSAGNEVASTEYTTSKPYCFKDGTIFMGDETVWRNGKQIFSYKENINDEPSFYENDVLYYPVLGKNGPNQIKAYDLKNQKELWAIDTAYDIVGVVGDYLISNNGELIADKKTGEIIAKSYGDSKIQAGYEYYAKYNVQGKRLKDLAIYNFENELVSKSTITYDDNCFFDGILTNGYYALSCYGANNNGSFLYNPKGELIRSDKSTRVYSPNRKQAKLRFYQINEIDTKDFSVINVSSSYRNYLLVYNDGRIIDYVTTTPYENSFSDPMSLPGNNQERKTFVPGKNPENKEEYLIYNLATGESVKTESNTGLTTIYGNNYVMQGLELLSQYGYDFYDKDLNKLTYTVEPNTAKVFALSDHWVIKQYINPKKVYLVDITSGDEKELNIELDKKNSITYTNATSVVVTTYDEYDKPVSYTIYRVE